MQNLWEKNNKEYIDKFKDWQDNQYNPGKYLGLKVKSCFGGSVPPDVTKEIESLLSQELSFNREKGFIESFDPWQS